eukprot:2808848-Pleurochrysis_carterae.AAC.3
MSVGSRLSFCTGWSPFIECHAPPFGYVDDIRRKLPHTICEEPMMQESGAFPHLDKARLLLH